MTYVPPGEIKEERCTVKYHTPEWEVLVETGWRTQSVDEDGTAHMLRQTRGGVPLK